MRHLLRHAWPTHLLFIALAAWLVMRTGNALLESSLLPLPAEKKSPRGAATTHGASLQLEATARVLGLPVPKPLCRLPDDDGTGVDLFASPVRSALRVRLLGTLVSEARPGWSVASIQDGSTLKTSTYMLGDRILGAEVVAIERSRVIVLNGLRLEFIDGAASERGPEPVALTGVRQLGANEYELSRVELERSLANLGDIATQARIVPAFKQGSIQGFKVLASRPDSVYAKLGVQNGDVIERVNGFALDSPERLLELYTKLKTTTRIDLELERNGASVRKTYTLK